VIDSKEKRQGITGVGRPYIRDKFPVAVPDEEWRIFSGNAYGGNALAAVAVTLLKKTRTFSWLQKATVS